MSLFSKLFGGGKPPSEPYSEVHEGYRIVANPAKDANGYRIGAIIEKDGHRHELIRADVVGDIEAANQASITKAKLLIDQIGMRVFDS